MAVITSALNLYALLTSPLDYSQQTTISSSDCTMHTPVVHVVLHSVEMVEYHILHNSIFHLHSLLQS